MKKYLSIPVVIALALGLAGCSTRTQGKESKIVDQQKNQFLQSQPVPIFSTSQLRQNVIELETAQAKATATTSFMFLLAGVGESGPMVHSCPSIGFPIPATYQLTAPEAIARWNGDNHEVTTPQMESTGVYTGDTTGTYVICVDPNGKPYAFYHEGYVSTVTGPAHWDTTKGEIVLDGASTAEFTKTP